MKKYSLLNRKFKTAKNGQKIFSEIGNPRKAQPLTVLADKCCPFKNCTSLCRTFSDTAENVRQSVVIVRRRIDRLSACFVVCFLERRKICQTNKKKTLVFPTECVKSQRRRHAQQFPGMMSYIQYIPFLVLPLNVCCGVNLLFWGVLQTKLTDRHNRHKKQQPDNDLQLSVRKRKNVNLKTLALCHWRINTIRRQRVVTHTLFAS